MYLPRDSCRPNQVFTVIALLLLSPLLFIGAQYARSLFPSAVRPFVSSSSPQGHWKKKNRRKDEEREREREREGERRSIRKVWRCSERRLERSFLPSLSLWSLVWITGGPAAKLIWNLQLLNSRSLPFTKVCLYFLFLGVNLFLNAELYFIYL